MVKKILFIKIAMFIAVSSCSVQKDLPEYISKKFTYCYKDQDTGINSLLEMDGYYVVTQLFKDIGYPTNKDTSYFNILFYDNGLCIFNFFPLDDKGRVINNKLMPSFFNTVIEDKESPEALYFYNYSRWASYIIEGDTIKAQWIYRPRFGETTTIWSLNEVWYKIINRTTIIEIPSGSEINPSASIKSRYVPARFVHVKEKPTPDSWLIKEDWFWCEGAK